jgi:hypothetical protein
MARTHRRSQVRGVASVHLSEVAGKMLCVGDDQTPDAIYGADAVGGTGPETRAVVSATRIKAGDLTDAHVGKDLGFHDHAAQLNIPGRILRVRRLDHTEDGLAPGVTIWYRLRPLPDGTPARESRMHVPFDTELELVEWIAF